MAKYISYCAYSFFIFYSAVLIVTECNTLFDLGHKISQLLRHWQKI